MKSFIYSLVAIAALSLGGVFASSANAAGPHGHQQHGGHNHGHQGHNHGYQGHNHGYQNHGHHNHYQSGWGNQHQYHNHGYYQSQNYYRPYSYAQPGGLYLQGRNFGFGIGF